MPTPYIKGESIDDVMRLAVEQIIAHGRQVVASKGPTKELDGVLLELVNPRARLSRTETRGKPFSCLGELCWYLAGTEDVHFIAYYIADYKGSADGDLVYGAYGPRMFWWKGVNQFASVASILGRKPSSRQAVIQIFDAVDLVDLHSHIPCTCSLQFMIRGGALNMFTTMRSNDAYLGLAHDIFAFTMLQEIMARTLGVELGTYKHAVGSLHLYDWDHDAAIEFIGEGWQSTIPMPPMPPGDPWPSIKVLLASEEPLRTQGEFPGSSMDALDSYWADLIHLLEAYSKRKDAAGLIAVRERISSPAYTTFIDQRLANLDSHGTTHGSPAPRSD